MERNLDKRIEVGAPILSKAIKKEISLIFDIQWSGNVKSRVLDKKMKNNYREIGDETPIRAQEELYKHYKLLYKQQINEGRL